MIFPQFHPIVFVSRTGGIVRVSGGGCRPINCVIGTVIVTLGRQPKAGQLPVICGCFRRLDVGRVAAGHRMVYSARLALLWRPHRILSGCSHHQDGNSNNNILLRRCHKTELTGVINSCCSLLALSFASIFQSFLLISIYFPLSLSLSLFLSFSQFFSLLLFLSFLFSPDSADMLPSWARGTKYLSG